LKIGENFQQQQQHQSQNQDFSILEEEIDAD
jgi:hypothetical protein